MPLQHVEQARFRTGVKPDAPEVVKAIDGELAKKAQ